MSESFWADMHEHQGFCNDDSYVCSLLIELRYLIENEKANKTETKSSASAPWDEAT